MAQPSATREINLNTAEPDDLARLPGIGSDKIWDLIQFRPYLNWDDVARIPGFTHDMVEVLQRAGAVVNP